MKWTEDQVAKLRELCSKGTKNPIIAKELGCKVEDVYAKRSQLGITIDKCKVAATPNTAFEKTLPPMQKKGMSKKVKAAFDALEKALLLAMASDFTSVEDATIYGSLSTVLNELEYTYSRLLS